MDESKRIALVIPSLEPDEKLIRLLHSLEGSISYGDVIVVNDGSSEAYQPVFDQAEALGCRILHHAVNLGKGRALKTAFNDILSGNEFAGAVIADSDGQHALPDILKCMAAMRANPEKLILGCRDFSQEQVPARSRMGNVLTRNVMKVLCGIAITDTQTGLRGIPCSFMRILMNVKGERYEFETNMLIAAKENEIGIVEVPIETIYIDGNQGSHFNPVKDSVRVYAMFGRYLFSSVSSFVIDIVLFSLFVRLLKGLMPDGYIWLSTAGARGISSFYNYSMNKNNVFHNKGNGRQTFVRYYLLCICQLGASAGLVSLVHGLLAGSETVIKILVDMCLFVVSYQIQREWVFKKNHE